MLRINLLPAYIAERKKTNLAIILASVLFVLVLAAMLGYHYLVTEPEIQSWREQAEEQERLRDAALKVKAEADAERAKIQPILDKVNFVETVQYHNLLYPRIYENASEYTIRQVEYDAMAVQGNTLTVSAYARSISDLARFYLTMFNNPDVEAVSIQGIPGWPNAASQRALVGTTPFGSPAQIQTGGTWFPVQLTARLVRAVSTPQLPASLLTPPGAAAAGSAVPGAGSTVPPGYEEE